MLEMLLLWRIKSWSFARPSKGPLPSTMLFSAVIWFRAKSLFCQARKKTNSYVRKKIVLKIDNTSGLIDCHILFDWPLFLKFHYIKLARKHQILLELSLLSVVENHRKSRTAKLVYNNNSTWDTKLVAIVDRWPFSRVSCMKANGTLKCWLLGAGGRCLDKLLTEVSDLCILSNLAVRWSCCSSVLWKFKIQVWFFSRVFQSFSYLQKQY
jgi:hypothetical protein